MNILMLIYVISKKGLRSLEKLHYNVYLSCPRKASMSVIIWFCLHFDHIFLQFNVYSCISMYIFFQVKLYY